MSWLNDLFTFGPAYDSTLDEQRILGQRGRVKAYLLNGQWCTLADIEAYTGYPQASISAQIRHLRKARFGRYVVIKRRKLGGQGGTWEYRLMPRTIPLDTTDGGV